MADVWQELVPQARSVLELDLGAQAVEAMRRFVGELERWAPKANLVSVGSPAETVTRHVLDSLAALRFLPADGATADVGSGAGFPGVPLSICHPGPMWLIESRRRRASFLRHVVRSLDLAATRVFEGRAEDFLEPVAAVVSRAIRPEIAIDLGRRLLAGGGRVLLLEKQASPFPAVPDFEVAGRLEYVLPGGLRHRVTLLERRST